MKRKKRPSQHKPTRRVVLPLAAIGIVLLVGLYWATRRDRPEALPQPTTQVEPTQTPTVARDVPPFHLSVEAASPLAPTLSPALFRSPIVAQAYRIAGQIPEVLAQQPCYCWCDKFGHGSLLDCFASDHGAT